MSDMVSSPPHYTAGRIEVIDFVEDCVANAPDAVVGGLQWQVIKYISRLWLKDNSLQDAKKCRWYLERLIAKLEAAQYRNV